MTTICALCRRGMVLVRGVYACTHCDHHDAWPANLGT